MEPVASRPVAPHPIVTRLLADAPGPVVAVTDFMKLVPDQIARFVPDRRSYRSARTASAGLTHGRRCVTSSRSTPLTSSWPSCMHSRSRAR